MTKYSAHIYLREQTKDGLEHNPWNRNARPRPDTLQQLCKVQKETLRLQELEQCHASLLVLLLKAVAFGEYDAQAQPRNCHHHPVIVVTIP